jgi:hypothetical protein
MPETNGSLDERVAWLRGSLGLVHNMPDGDCVYSGDLEAGKRLAAEERSFWIEHDVEHPDGERWRVYLCDQEGSNEGCTPASEEEASYYGHEIGIGTYPEQAWRYALGAMFGPDDENYHQGLVAALIAAIDPMPKDPEELEPWLAR